MRVCVCVQLLSCIQLFGAPWTVPARTPVHGIFQMRIWSGLPFPTPGDLSDPGILPESPALAGGFFTTSATWEALYDPAFLLLDNFTKEK